MALPAERRTRGSAPRLKRARTALAALAATLFSLTVLLGMDRWNTDSVRPRLEDLWLMEPVPRERLERSDYDDVFTLAETEPTVVAAAAGVSPERARRWVEAARLATLRGIGAANARLLWDSGIHSVEELAAADPAELTDRLAALRRGDRQATAAKVRVWVRAARRESDS